MRKPLICAVLAASLVGGGCDAQTRQTPASIVPLGSRHSMGGGHVVTTARITGDGRIVGDEQIVGGHKLPEGFKVPEVTIEMKRARGTVTVR